MPEMMCETSLLFAVDTLAELWVVYCTEGRIAGAWACKTTTIRLLALYLWSRTRALP